MPWTAALFFGSAAWLGVCQSPIDAAAVPPYNEARILPGKGTEEHV
ncbi:hypothetical protein J21TS7_18860 [Paenibacillus cineris]|uniref:Uncharacterized protein n=1 Tax=Paenibacillus cineris TaxID=237530 RepID=A0ABQ4LAW2_9BACL|nr:hypothetical protein J21TS7_18860 [Paenibacillus cineris]